MDEMTVYFDMDLEKDTEKDKVAKLRLFNRSSKIERYTRYYSNKSKKEIIKDKNKFILLNVIISFFLIVTTAAFVFTAGYWCYISVTNKELFKIDVKGSKDYISALFMVLFMIMCGLFTLLSVYVSARSNLLRNIVRTYKPDYVKKCQEKVTHPADFINIKSVSAIKASHMVQNPFGQTKYKSGVYAITCFKNYTYDAGLIPVMLMTGEVLADDWRRTVALLKKEYRMYYRTHRCREDLRTMFKYIEENRLSINDIQFTIVQEDYTDKKYSTFLEWVERLNMWENTFMEFAIHD